MEFQNQKLVGMIRVIRRSIERLDILYRHKIRMPIWRKKERLKLRYRLYKETTDCCVKIQYNVVFKNRHTYYITNHKDLDMIGHFLMSDIEFIRAIPYLEGLYDDTVHGLGGNLTDLEKIGDMVSLTYLYPDFYSDEPYAVTMTRDQMAQLIRDWMAICDKPGPDDVIVVARDDKGIYNVYIEPIKKNRLLEGCRSLWKRIVLDSIAYICSLKIVQALCYPFQCIHAGWNTFVAPARAWLMDLWIEAGGPYYTCLQLSNNVYDVNTSSDILCARTANFFAYAIKMAPEPYYAWAIDPEQRTLAVEHVLLTKENDTITITFDPKNSDDSVQINQSNFIDMLIIWRDIVCPSLPHDVIIIRQKSQFFVYIPSYSAINS